MLNASRIVQAVLAAAVLVLPAAAAGLANGEYVIYNRVLDPNGEMLAMQPFERIGPDSTSMDGPVTHARAMRGEIPVRGTNAREPYYIKPEDRAEDNSVSFAVLLPRLR